MEVFNFKNDSQLVVLAMGSESAGSFSIFRDNQLYYFSGFGDLLEANNFEKYQKELLCCLKKENLNPDIILIDLHPLFETSQLGCELAKKYKAKLIKIQHHYAHIGAAVLDKIIDDNNFKINNFTAITSDGTGYGLDENIWGGEVFKYEVESMKLERIGSLEEQILIGGDAAIREPARMLLSVLLKIKKNDPSTMWRMTSFFNKKELNILIKQYEQKFNCQITTSTGRILDAVSFLLGFCENKREYKHQPIDLLEQNSTEAYELEPKIEFNEKNDRYIISTSYLFEYLINNLDNDKQRLAATAQLYLAKGFYRVAQKYAYSHTEHSRSADMFFSGGIANNKIISEYLKFRGVYLNKKIPCDDKGISLGQIGYYLLTNPGD